MAKQTSPVRLDFPFSKEQADALQIHYALLGGYTYYDIQRALARNEYPTVTHLMVQYNLDYNDSTNDVAVTKLVLLEGDREIESFTFDNPEELEVRGIKNYSYDVGAVFIIPISLL